MHPALRLTALAVAAVATRALSPPSAAPAADTTRPATPAAATPSRGGPDRANPDRANQASAVDQRVAALRAKLQITPAQEPQWNQFAQVMRDNAQRMDDSFQRRAQMIGTQNAEDNMASYAQMAMAHAQGMQNLVPAFHTLYGTMSDLQKRAADQVFRDDAHGGTKPRGRQGPAR